MITIYEVIPFTLMIEHKIIVNNHGSSTTLTLLNDTHTDY